MIIPKVVKIGYKDYTVNDIKDLHNNTNLLYGQIKYDSEVIELNTIYTDNQKKCTLIHEIIHGIDDMRNIGLQEEQVLKLGIGMFELVKDNPDMFKEDLL